MDDWTPALIETVLPSGYFQNNSSSAVLNIVPEKNQAVFNMVLLTITMKDLVLGLSGQKQSQKSFDRPGHIILS